MANLSQKDGATKPGTNNANVSSVRQALGGHAPAVPCLIPSFTDAVKLLNSQYSCLVLDTHRRHVVLPPVYLRRKRTGIQEELNSELLKYSRSLKGVPLAYDDLKIVGQLGDIYDDQGFVHLNVEASFVTFRPKKDSKLVGVINKVGVGHVGCLVHGCFNACVVKPGQLTTEQWRDCGMCVGENVEFEVFQMDADAAGVLLIRGRLERSRVQELVAQAGQAKAATEPESTEDTIESPKPKKKKKKDKHQKRETLEDSVDDSTTYDNQEMNVEVDSNSNILHKKKKKKKDKRKDSDETLPSDLPASDSSGYLSDKTSRKRRAEEIRDDAKAPLTKKTKHGL